MGINDAIDPGNLSGNPSENIRGSCGASQAPRHDSDGIGTGDEGASGISDAHSQALHVICADFLVRDEGLADR